MVWYNRNEIVKKKSLSVVIISVTMLLELKFSLGNCSMINLFFFKEKSNWVSFMQLDDD